MQHDARTEGELELRATHSHFIEDVFRPVQRFIRIEWIGSAVLLVASIVALVWANSPWAASYESLWHTPVGMTLGGYRLEFDLHHLVNEGLMAVFFFVIALEVKREFVRGALSTRQSAALPVVAAIGGMVVPALLYLLVVGEGGDLRGWGVPMATDIAFALGALGILGRQVPHSLRIFLLALAVVDDLGAIVIIALFYSGPLNVAALSATVGITGLIYVMQRLGIRQVFAYAVVGFALWLAVYESGVHATIAGVILGFTAPSSPYFGREEFRARMEELLDRLDRALAQGDKSLAQGVLGQFEVLAVDNEAPLERALRHFQLWSSLVILPIFALANAGVSVSWAEIQLGLTHPITVGVILGLIVGKLVGISLASWVAVRTGLAELPEGAHWGHILGVSALAGIGFTVAMFIAELAFVSDERIAAAKMGILLASGLAALLGIAILSLGKADSAPETGAESH